MTPRTALLSATLIAFSAYSAAVILDVGYAGIFDGAMANPGSAQVFFDLVIVCGLACLWLIGDARKRGMRAWPWVIAIAGGGSIALMAYLLLRELRGGAPEPSTSDRSTTPAAPMA